MKKLIAFSVMFALLAGAVVFADVSIGGQVQMAATLLSGNNTEKGKDDTKVSMGGVGIGDNNHHVNFRFGDATAGGIFRVYSAKNGGLPGHFDFFSFVYWQPIEMFRIQMGQNPDGDWGAAQITGWGFTAEAKNGVAAISDYAGGLYMAARTSAFYGGISARSINLSLYPIEMLTINFGVPMPGSERVGNQLADFHFNAVFKIEGIGDARLSFQGAGGMAKDQWETKSPGDVYINFYLTALDALKAEIGFKIGIPVKDGDPAFSAGAGVTFGADAFAIKFRGGANFGPEQTTVISANLLPSISIGKATAFLYAGLGVGIPSDKDANAVIDWFVNPYLSAPAGSLRLYAGFRLWQQGITKDYKIGRAHV